MTNRLPRLLARATRAVLLLPALAGAAAAQARRDEPDSFQWEGRVPVGRWVYLHNVNGDVRVEPGTGDRVEVRATKHWRRGDPDAVKIEAKRARDGESVVVCALWDDERECDEDGYAGRGRRNWWGDDRNDVSVEFTVYVPRGVKVDMNTTNGGITVRGATAEVVANTTNGSVRAETSGGPVSARTTNGSIEARMRELGSARDLEFSTTNGSVIVEVPAALGAEVDMATVNGSVITDFPMTVSGRIDRRRLRATIGDGSRRLRMHTVNGNVELRKQL
jgi:hypothetical protein